MTGNGVSTSGNSGLHRLSNQPLTSGKITFGDSSIINTSRIVLSPPNQPNPKKPQNNMATYTKELTHCPFCASKAILLIQYDVEDGLYAGIAECVNQTCSCKIVKLSPDKDDALNLAETAWNNRPETIGYIPQKIRDNIKFIFGFLRAAQAELDFNPDEEFRFQSGVEMVLSWVERCKEKVTIDKKEYLVQDTAQDIVQDVAQPKIPETDFWVISGESRPKLPNRIFTRLEPGKKLRGG